MSLQLKCEQCGAPFRATDLHLERGLATCAACGGVQRLPEPVAADVRGGEERPSSRKPPGDVPVPARFTIENNGTELVIRRSWFQFGLFFLLFFAIAWDSFLIGWYWMLAGPMSEP
ncbi:MAG TPA: hypothetical protein VK137_15510, partial [Planctomycetaceae bacterium]|nr:hypothetical protein [Planctomycetaceae bacterium]